MEARGAVNSYRCGACDRSYATINLNAGTTPFLSACPDCNATAESNFYNVTDAITKGKITIDHVWYRPTPVKFSLLHLDTQEHIVFGGLITGCLGEAVAMKDDITPDWSLKKLLAFMREFYEISDELEELIRWRLSAADTA